MIDRWRGLTACVWAVLWPLLAVPAFAQIPTARLKKAAAEAEEKVKEEQDRIAKKKAAVQLEFENLQKPDVRLAVSDLLESLAKKHAAALKATAPTDSKAVAAVPEDFRKDVLAALKDAGRNLSELLVEPVARNLAEAIRKGEDFAAAAVFGESVTEIFGEPRPFDAVWTEVLAGVYEKNLRTFTQEWAAARNRWEDAEEAEKNAVAGIPPGMIEVPGGKYEIGENPDVWTKVLGTLGYKADKKLPAQVYGTPRHTVTLEGFYLDRNEVTNRWWAAYCRDTGAAPPPHWVSAENPADAMKTPDPEGGPRRPAPQGRSAAPSKEFPGMAKVPAEGTEDCPVTWINYLEAEAFAKWCGARVPTEFEWEAAARAPGAGEKTRRQFPFGDLLDRAKAQVNYAAAGDDPRVKAMYEKTGGVPPMGGNQKKLPRVTPVGVFAEGRSALGFNDLAGNAMEMTSSPFVAYPKWEMDKGPACLPMEDKESFSPELISARGGHFLSNDLLILTWMRRGIGREAKFESVGFRRAASKVRGKDVVEAMPAKSWEAKLSDTGEALADEKKAGSRFPRIAFEDASTYSAVKKGGWNEEKQIPARASWMVAASRTTREFSDPAKIRHLAKDLKGAVLLGWFRTDVPLV
ncbi:MAG TPA: SUMF1/EgtB/PvdO family nonheme iron enzyme, partial [Planctomycetota bacterium]|nr:SUMF1/EgtB/PvdO family nonheme iron enzyme [Planctomycetota bacterium]